MGHDMTQDQYWKAPRFEVGETVIYAQKIGQISLVKETGFGQWSYEIQLEDDVFYDSEDTISKI